ncbi:MAG TPA: polysaccharide biosynthesis/export family protein [Bryobacteraceae bacterium]|nr:polysaccharide biosynthesis/export family protein [Bryobacteraceae bacterium]
MLLSVLLLGGQATVPAVPVTPPRAEEASGALRQVEDRRQEAPSTYVLGPDDQIEVRAVDADLGDKPVRIDISGFIRLPLLGRFKAAELTIDELEDTIAERLKEYVREPDVTVSVTEYRSQPVSVIGAVKNPGVHQLQGRKTLIEILSLAGGLEQDAGSRVKITRGIEWGRIPLKNATNDATGRFSVAEVSVQRILNATSPQENILVRPHDVISVPRAELIYVTGQVQRSGGFVLNDREGITVLQALSLAGGLDRSASPKNARILRRSNGPERTELAVNMKSILEGKGEDFLMLPDDILFIPSSAPKRAALRAAEAAIQVGTGLVIWRR